MKKSSAALTAVATSICLLCGRTATAQNLIANGDFNSGDLTGWTATPNAPTTITYDAGTGNPSGSAFLARNNSAAAANANYLYQIIPVVNGAQYKLSAHWKGDLLNGGTGRNWAEVFVNFSDSATFVPGTIRYKKATDGGPNAIPMPWDWEDITASPDNSNPGPADGVFTATGNYMIVTFNLGGRAQTSNNTQPGYYRVDNVSVTPWPPTSAPVFTSARQSGAGIILEGANGPSHGAYEMLQSTDLGSPVGTWQGLGIRAFDGNGNFSSTNLIDPSDAAAFYKVRVVSSVPVFPPVITAQPQDFAASVGYDATFNVTATGSTPLTYRWYYNTNTLLASGSGSSLTLTNVQVSDSGTISVIVSNLLGTAQSTYATLTVTNSTQPPVILSQPTNLTVFVGQTAQFSVTAIGALPLQYQWYFNTNTVLIDETNSTLTLANVQLANAGRYSVTITNLYGTTNSAFATLTVSSNSSLELIGWAALPAYGTATTTGGGNTTPQLVTDLATLRTLAGDGTPRVLLLSGTFVTGSTAIEVASNKTLRGADQNAKIQGGLRIVDRSNVIIQNLSVQGNGQGGTPADAIEVRGTHHAWFDHLTVWEGGDGNLDLTRGCDYITVSWSKFYYTNASHTHRLCTLVGGGSTHADTDWGKNNVTFHHNWYSSLVNSRMPRLLFGKGHFFNNYYNAPGNSYCIGTGSWASGLVENNYFKQVQSPHQYQDTNPSYIAASGNIYDTCTGNQHTGLGYPDNDGNDPGPWIPTYNYTLDPAANVPAMVTAGAGPQ